MRDEISLKLLADTYPDVIVSRETPSSPPPPPPGLHPTSSTTDGCWPPSLDAAGAISISAIVAFSSTSTAAVVTFFWQQLSKVSLRLLDPFEHMPAHVPLSCPRSIIVLADSDSHACLIVFSVTSTAILIATARAGRGREPRLDRRDAPLACTQRRCILPSSRSLLSPSDRECASAALASRPRVAGHIFKSGLFPEFERPRSQALTCMAAWLRAHRDGATGFEPRHAEPPHRGGSTTSR